MYRHAKVDARFKTMFPGRTQGGDYFTPWFYTPEQAMVMKLTAGNGDKGDIAFSYRESTEALLCDPYFDLPDGQYRAIQRKAHGQVLRNPEGTTYDLYHPSVKAAFPGCF